MPYPHLLIIGHYTVYSNQTRQKSPDLKIIIIIVKKAFPYLIIELVCSIQRYVITVYRDVKLGLIREVYSKQCFTVPCNILQGVCTQCLQYTSLICPSFISLNVHLSVVILSCK